MGFRKYQSVEKTDVLSEDDHKKVEAKLHKLGKTSMTELDEDERNSLVAGLDPASLDEQ